MPEVSPLIRLFVSSTFADFTFEREVLQRSVFPRLRTLCAAQGCRFQPIDLRWGVSEEAANNKQTLAICLEEIARCQRLSPDLNLLVLLGERYGSSFLPTSIPSHQVARLLPHLAADAQAAFTQAYREDRNALRPAFVLLPGDGFPASTQSEESLRQALAHAATLADFSAEDRLPFVASATHIEITHGLLNATCDPNAVLCAHRTFDAPPQTARLAQYVEHEPHRRAQLAELKAVVEQRLAGRVWRYRAPGQLTGPHMGQAARTLYRAVAEGYYALLEPRIQQALALRRPSVQRRDPTDAANRQFAAARASVVVGRDDALSAIATYLADGTPQPLVVIGDSGVGKSTLLARAVEDAARAAPDAVILTRYIGITPGTSTLADLLTDLRRDIAARYGLPTPTPAEDLSQLVAAFADLLNTLDAPATHPLALFIDALDQLGAHSQRIDWLPPTLAPHVRVVLSVLADYPEADALRSRLPATQLLSLTPLTRTQSADVLRAWLSAEGRRLTPEQERAVLDGFATEQDGRVVPLALRLAFEQARAWRSFDPVQPLPSTVPALIQTYLNQLGDPRRHGREFVAYALGDLAVANHGLAEDELLDLLARSAAVRQALARLNPEAPPVKAQRPLPVAIWARLAADLDHYLTAREPDGTRLLTFYHRQIREAVERRYLVGANRVARHADLAAYFSTQPYWLGEVDRDGVTGVVNVLPWNRRKLAELAYQQVEAGPDARPALQVTLTDGRFLEGKLTEEGVAATVADLALLTDDEPTHLIANVVRAGTLILIEHPEELMNQVQGREGGIPALHHPPARPTPYFALTTRSLRPADAALQAVLSGHTGPVYHCALSADGRTALSDSDGRTLRVWDVASGTELRRFAGHTSPVTRCALSADGRTALSGSFDGTLRVWDVATGAELRRLEGHTDKVRGCALSADGRTALSASDDQTLRLWHVASGAAPRRFAGHTGPVNGCALSADGRTALSASGDRTLRLWDVASGVELRRLEGHTGTVFGCALSADGRTALSASYDQTLRLWDVASGTELAVWYGDDAILCGSFGPGDAGVRVVAGDWFGGVHVFVVVGLQVGSLPEYRVAPSLPGAPVTPPTPPSRRRKLFGIF